MQARGARIRRKREGAGYGLRAFADLIGISPSWLSRIERDQASPSPDVLRRIALALQQNPHVTAAIAEIAYSEISEE
ncbi:helix-turn-helix domain-containing protein [Streptomyces sp. NBRC 109706]|uniref:helix-turn-helix domain-containing protein n=1 Tax=Streptomyces sp. NBRC 109706 TaxID=1550035 RepID=UPI00099CC8F2|nr:helix-turn-helix transcriptional regulator [Streptomyces sp. NBRC 109706]